MKKNNVAIKITNLTKTFNVYYDKNDTLKSKIINFGRDYKEKRLVLDNISLEIKKGESVALIGVNGCGKSTLLKLITRILYPNGGNIKVDGKVTSLLELGAGFHPDFTGRENIYFNASIFGLNHKEIDERIDEIIKFSELEKYIDNPIRTYSSGMYMRLAFSIAINVNADILLIDEILAVGDAKFQRKCIDKMLELKNSGKTIVFVSHDAEAVKFLCNRSIWISDCKIKMDDKTDIVINSYMESLSC